MEVMQQISGGGARSWRCWWPRCGGCAGTVHRRRLGSKARPAAAWNVWSGCRSGRSRRSIWCAWETRALLVASLARRLFPGNQPGVSRRGQSPGRPSDEGGPWLACVLRWHSPAPRRCRGRAVEPLSLFGISAGKGGSSVSVPMQIVILLTLMTLLPAAIMSITPFLRITIVLHFLRQALGTQTTPSNQVLLGLALFLTILIMQPVAADMYHQGWEPHADRPADARAGVRRRAPSRCTPS